MNAQKLGKLLCDFRAARQLSPNDLAARLGISPTAYAALEAGKKQPSVKTFVALCNALQCTAEELLQWLSD